MTKIYTESADGVECPTCCGIGEICTNDGNCPHVSTDCIIDCEHAEICPTCKGKVTK